MPARMPCSTPPATTDQSPCDSRWLRPSALNSRSPSCTSVICSCGWRCSVGEVDTEQVRASGGLVAVHGDDMVGGEMLRAVEAREVTRWAGGNLGASYAPLPEDLEDAILGEGARVRVPVLVVEGVRESQ